MTLHEYIAILKRIELEHPDCANKPIQFVRDNGKRRCYVHEVTSYGCSTIYSCPPELAMGEKRATIHLDFDGEKIS